MYALELDLIKRSGDFVLNASVRTTARRLGVTGPSGSGKTTLLNCIAGIAAIDQGRIAVDGRAFAETHSTRRPVPARLRRVGYVPQEALLFPHMTVRANLRYGSREGGPAFDDVVRVLDLDRLLDRAAPSLSGGEARRVAMGRALLSNPRLLLLDEPLTGLDRPTARRVLAYLNGVLRTFDVPAVYVSHTISDIIFLCEEVWVLDGGRVTAIGPPRSAIAVTEFEAADDELENLFIARRLRRESEQVTAFQIGVQALFASTPEEPVADEAVLAVRADEIILARQRPGRISARNVLTGRVERIAAGKRFTTVFVDVGVEWMVSLTPAAVAELELVPGVEVFAIVKASAVATSTGTSPGTRL